MIAKAGKRVAIYARVSTQRERKDKDGNIIEKAQTTQNQLVELRDWAARAGHEVVQVYEDLGISGAKGRDKRPQFDALLKGATRREFDMIAVWSSDRLGRSLAHLVDVLQTIQGAGIGLYIHTQAVDTTTPSGRAMFGMLSVFAEFEREMIKDRVNAGMSRAQDIMDRRGEYQTRKGTTIRRFGRPGASPAKLDEARELLKQGLGIHKIREKTGLGTCTIVKVRKEMQQAA